MLGAGRMGGERGGRAAAHSEDPAVGTSATELPHIVPETVRRERLRSQTESGCDHRAAGSAAGNQPNFGGQWGRFVFIGLGEGVIVPGAIAVFASPGGRGVRSCVAAAQSR